MLTLILLGVREGSPRNYDGQWGSLNAHGEQRTRTSLIILGSIVLLKCKTNLLKYKKTYVQLLQRNRTFYREVCTKKCEEM